MADRSGQHIDNYQLLRLLGQGTFGDVYLARHMHKHITVAVKVLTMQFSQEMLEDFLRETRVLFLLRHPHIVPLLDFGLENKTPFLVVEYAPSGTLRQRHRSGERVALDLVNTYVQQMALALQYAHEQRLIHRDVNPQNMLLGQNGQVLLSDFGVAAIVHSEHSLPLQGITGTISYMAPEQIQGKPCLASDQYALGICAYEWLCGARPFAGSTMEIMTQHLSAAPIELRTIASDVPSAVEEVVLQALTKDPHQRFSSVAAFATAFQQACQRPASPATHKSQASKEASVLLETGTRQPSIYLPPAVLSQLSSSSGRTTPDTPANKDVAWDTTLPVSIAAPGRQKRRWQWRLLAAVATAIVLLLGTGIFAYTYYLQTLSTPQKTLAAYCDGLKTRNAPEIYNQLDAKIRHQISVSQLQTILNAIGSAKSCAYSDIRQNGSAASGTVNATLANNQHSSSEMTLILENGNWRIEAIANKPS